MKLEVAHLNLIKLFDFIYLRITAKEILKQIKFVKFDLNSFRFIFFAWQTFFNSFKKQKIISTTKKIHKIVLES